MNESDHDLLIKIAEKVTNIDNRLKDEHERLNGYDKRIRNLENTIGVVGVVWVLLAGAIGWLYKTVWGLK